MTPFEREELRRAKDWTARGRLFLASGQIELATECFAFAEEHLKLAMMTDQELIQQLAACRSYEDNGVDNKGNLI
jgi:hypothetical protein